MRKIILWKIAVAHDKREQIIGRKSCFKFGTSMGAAAAEGQVVAKGVAGSSSSRSSRSSVAAGKRKTISVVIKSAETTIGYVSIEDYCPLSILIECF